MNIPKPLIALTGEIRLHNWPPFAIFKPPHYKVTGQECRNVLDALKPGDILLRTYSGYLNTLFTPGDWGHAALYCTDNQVIHAVGEGVTTEDILTFLRTDSVCVLRPKVRHRKKLQAIKRALKSLHAPYDYEFGGYCATGPKTARYCTMAVDWYYCHLFKHEYTEKLGHEVLTPQAMFDSDHVDIIYEVRH